MARSVCQDSDMIVFSGNLKLSSSFVESNIVLIVIVILIVIDMKGAQALRAAGQPVVAGLVLRCGAPRVPATQSRQRLLSNAAAAQVG